MKIKIVRKIILTAAVCAVFLTACGSKNTSETSPEKASANEITTENTAAKTIKEQTDSTKVNTEEIDIKVPENAAYRRTELKYSQGKLSTISLNFFDEHDKCIYLFSQPAEDSNDEWATTFDCSYSYKYNDDGTMAEMNMVTSDDIQTLIQFEDSDDKTVRKETVYRNGKLWDTAVTAYDEHSNPMRTEITYENAKLGSYISTYEYEYDPDGRILVEKHSKDNDSLDYTKLYTYDDNGNTASVETQNAALGFSELIKYAYNSDNRLVKEQNFINGEESSYAEYEYEFYN